MPGEPKTKPRSVRQYALLRNLSSLASAYQRKMDQVNATTKASSLYDPSTATSPMTDTPATGQEALFSAATSDTDKTKLTVTEDQLPKAAGSVVSMKQVSTKSRRRLVSTR